MSRKHIKKRKYFKNKTHNIDYYGDGPVRTKFEYMAEGLLKEVGMSYRINQVFCFTCNNFYQYESMNYPERCVICGITFKGDSKGFCSRPDFILVQDESSSWIKPFDDLSKIGILRIDGGVHKGSKATRITDYHILNAYRERKIKVFIIENETFVKKTVKELREFFKEIKLMMENDALYQKYANSKHFEELTFCPDIQGKRYNKSIIRKS